MQHLDGDWTHVDSPEKLALYAKAIAAGTIEFPVFVVGPGGTGKSETFKRYLPDYNANDPDHVRNKRKYAVWMEGTISPVQLFVAIAKNKDRTLIADDCPDLQRVAASRALLKQLCNTRRPTKVVYDKMIMPGSPLDMAGVDTTIMTNSVFVVIANHWQVSGPDMEAINTRAKLIYYSPSILTRIKYAETWLKDQEILRFLRESYRKGVIHRLHFRHLAHAQDYKRSGIEPWKHYLLRMFEPAEVDVTDDPGKAILRWAERNTDGGVFTAALVKRGIRAFQGGSSAALDDALKGLVDRGLIHQLPAPPREKGDKSRKPPAVYALGPAETKATNATTATRRKRN